MSVHQRRRLMMVVLAAALVVSAVAASNASAVLKRLPNGQTVSYQPLNDASSGVSRFDAVFQNMDYNGGPVMPSNTNYMVLWSPNGLSAYPPEFVRGVAQYFRDLAHDSGGNQNVDSVGPQYNDLTGAIANYDSHFGGVLLDTHPYPPSVCPATAPVTNCLTDPEIQQELVNFVTARHLKTDLSHEYFLLTPPHVESCFSANPATNFDGCSAGEPAPFRAFCAYHQNTALPTMLFYANDPYDADNSHCQDFNYPNGISDGEINGGLSHEHMESVTDPIPNDAWTNGDNSANPSNQGSEVGDQCNRIRGNPLGTAPNGAKFNQVINGHFYWYQEEWSNLTHSCVQRLTLPATLPTANETVTAGDGTAMTFDASRSTAPGGVADYSWQFNAVLNAPTVEQTTPTITYTFPAAGAYSTGVTVFNSDGLSAGTGGIVTTGQDGFQPAFTVSHDSQDRSDKTVSFSALTTVSGQPVMNYMWEFGDGSTGSGPTPTHRYARPGTYTVTAVLFSGVGSAFPGQGAGPIYAQKIRVGEGHGG